MNHSWHSVAVHGLLEPKIKTYLIGRFPIAITKSPKNVTGLWICADCESCSTLERAKTCRHQCTWCSVQLPEVQYFRTALMFKYDLFIALGLSQFSCSFFFRDHYTITHSSGEFFFYELWDSFILETERLMSRLTTQTMKLLNAQVLD